MLPEYVYIVCAEENFSTAPRVLTAQFGKTEQTISW